MFETGRPFCPVLLFEKYVSRLNPKNEYLFQRPKKAVDESDEVWYDHMVVGQRTLGDKMKKLALLRVYKSLNQSDDNHNT